MPSQASKKATRRTGKSTKKGSNPLIVATERFRQAATAAQGLSPWQRTVFKTPLFPSVIRQNDMLYYEPNLSLTMPLAGTVGAYVFAANGIFDPNITGTGHQPMGFDQMMSLYNQCTVVRSSCSVSFEPSWNSRVGICLSPAAALGTTDSRVIVENGYLKSISITGSGTQIVHEFPKLTLDFDTKKYFGVKTDQELLDNPYLYTTAAANPTELAYFQIVGWQNMDLPGSDKTLYFDVELSYDAIFWEPKKEGISVKTGPIPLTRKIVVEEGKRPAALLR
jgi:hypothetical protein